MSRPKLVSSLGLIASLYHLRRYGVVSFFAGLGLVVNTLAHWPGTHQPMPLWFAQFASGLGLALILFATVLFAVALHELQGHWTPLAVLPGVNVLAVGGLIASRLGGRSPFIRVISDAVLLGLFVGEDHLEPWLGVALVLVAVTQMQWMGALIDVLCPPSKAVLPTT